MNDQVWQSLRYFLIAGGSFLAGRGKISTEQVGPLADALITAGGAVVAAGGAVWGFYVKWRTATVPAATAARVDVPVVDAATGKVK